jgi:HSP20 family molecular chaperone IbpA
MSDDRDPDDDRGAERSGLLGGLRSLLEALADAERDGTNRIDRSRRSEKGRFSTEIGLSGRIGPPSLGRSPGSDAGSDPSSITGRSEPDGRPDVDHHVDVRHDDDGRLVVVADMPGVEHEELTVGLDEASNELVVGVENRAIERLPLPWPVDDVEGRFNHGVLELRITAAEGTS